MKKILRDEEGVVLVVALILLLVLTLIGISSISTTSFESIISGNDRSSNAAFYAAEAALHVGMKMIPDKVHIGSKVVISRVEVKSGDDEYLSGSVFYQGLAFRPYFDQSWNFNRYQINAIGEYTGSRKDIETQVSYGPLTAGTNY